VAATQAGEHPAPPPVEVAVAVAVLVGVGVRVAVAVLVAVALDVAVAVTRVVAVAVAVAVARDVAVALFVAVAVARTVAVAVAVAPLQAPLFVHQLSELGSKGELGGQSRVAGMAASAVYFELLKTTDVPAAYAVQAANAGTPEQLTCADDGAAASAVTNKTPADANRPRALMRPPPKIAWKRSGEHAAARGSVDAA
jgi:hypothetical protein